jgi:hypothetical protein
MYVWGCRELVPVHDLNKTDDQLLVGSFIDSPRLGIFFIGLTQALTMLSMHMAVASWNIII